MSDKTRADNLALALRNCEGEVTALRSERGRYHEALEWVIATLEDELRDGGKVPVLPEEIRERAGLSEAGKR